MLAYQCSACYFPYEEILGLPELDIAPGTLWADVPDDFVCPDCGTAKSDFMGWNKEA